jgi:hypothetical protein
VTLGKTENNNKQKVDALDLSGELSLVEDMNLSQERERNVCVWLYLLRMSVRSLDSGEAYAFKYRNISLSAHISAVISRLRSSELLDNRMSGMVCVGKLSDLRGSDDR